MTPSLQNDSQSAGIVDCWNRIGVRGDGSCRALEQYIHCRNCPVYSSAAAQLFNRALPEESLAQWTAHYAEPARTGEAATESAVIFRIGAEWLALPTTLFKEIAESRPIHSLPHRRSGFVMGLANVRGELLVCVSLAELLGIAKTGDALKNKAQSAIQRLLVIGREGTRAVFPADEVHGTERYRPGDVKEAPTTVSRAAATYTRAVLPWRDRTVGLLDEELLFHTLNRSFA